MFQVIIVTTLKERSSTFLTINFCGYILIFIYDYFLQITKWNLQTIWKVFFFLFNAQCIMVFQKRFTQFTSFLCSTPTIAFIVLRLNKFHVIEFLYLWGQTKRWRHSTPPLMEICIQIDTNTSPLKWIQPLFYIFQEIKDILSLRNFGLFLP